MRVSHHIYTHTCNHIYIMYISPSFHFNMKHLGGQALSEVRLNCWGAAKQHMSMVLAFFLELSLHQLSHQSHSCPPLGCCDRSQQKNYQTRSKKKSSAHKIPTFP